MSKQITVLLLLLLARCIPVVAQNEMSTILARISKEVFDETSDAQVTKGILAYKANMNNDGSWPDIRYDDRSATLWLPTAHLDRIRLFAAGYCNPRSIYAGDETLFRAISNGLQYWCRIRPKSNNWWHNDINTPQHLGQILAMLQFGKKQLPPALQDSVLKVMESARPPSAFTGANKLDIAIHYICRAAVLQDAQLMQTAVDEAFQPISFTTKEGLQNDYSYLQHKEQLQISSYGLVFLIGSYRVAAWLAGTHYAIPREKHTLLDHYFFNSFARTLRGGGIDYNVEGRGISRPNALDKTKIVDNNDVAGLFSHILAVSPEQATALAAIKARLLQQEPPSYQVTPGHTYFWRGDYTLHLRPGYSFNVRTVSRRTIRTESGNGENMLGTVLPDGSVNLVRRGNEYLNIMPAWEWDKIPGVTARDYDTAVVMKTDWGVYGSTDFTGGVTDSLYGVTAYTLNYDSVTAKKSWFFFDNEVVCLGAEIHSNAPEPITTTINQAWANGPVIINENGRSRTLDPSRTVVHPRWVWHDSIAYFFPEPSAITISNKEQSGDWSRINYSRKGTVNGKVFKLWFDHNSKPQDASYSYIVVPGIGANNTGSYNPAAVRILSNTADLQAVAQQQLGILQAVFYKPGSVTLNDITVTVAQPCIVQVRNMPSGKAVLHVADPTQQLQAIPLSFTSSKIKKDFSVPLPKGPYAGQSVSLLVE
ncbi:polysaccharide lyase 8 family protein [Niabella pedocola]|uniref:Polysaccharide lyase 8 family protein n=1 Tax=Niabella pedocola TaxID=1752077 RepID=A0ABS8PWH0_9BACT|nr:polysaccharide lyase 8 family protein [Niabella pedocola]MCD2425413.1 polysaccharide lyase 8 family protein [Niabella pedocola]